MSGSNSQKQDLRIATKRIRKPPLEPRSRDAELPLSFAQQRLWFIAQSETGSVAYNEPFFVRLKGRLDVPALKRSLQQVVRRHEVLRTTFGEEQGRLVQRIVPELRLDVPIEGLEEHPEPEKGVVLQTRAVQELARPFDLEKGPLLRARLLRLASDEHVLLLVMHHIVCDGWSMDVLQHELSSLYQSFSSGKEPELPCLPVQYADYSAWQRKWLSGDVLETQLGYWKQHLDGRPQFLELQTDEPRRAVQTFNGAVLKAAVPTTLAAKLRAMNRREGVTLYMVLMAVFDVMLYRYTGQADIVVGSPIAGRTHSKIEGLIGCFVNTLALRVQVSGDMTFRQLLMRVCKVSLAAEAAQDVPFESVVNALHAKRDLARTPLFQVMFEYQTASFPLSLPGIQAEELPFDPGVAKFDLTLLIRDSPEEMTCIWEFNSDLFHEPTVKRMARHYLTLLEGAIAEPDRPLSLLPMLTEEERHELLVEWNKNDDAPSPAASIHEFFESQAERTPEANAVIDNEHALTFRELNERANRVAHRLRQMGVGPEVLVGICMERSAKMVVALLGVLKAGGGYVPLDPAYPRGRLSTMLEDSCAPVLIVEKHLLEKLPTQERKILILDSDSEQLAGESGRNPVPLSSPDNIAYMIYTSGSTGRPKGVMIQHRGLLNLRRAFHELAYADLHRPMRIALNSSFSFDASVQQLVQLTHGHTLCIVPADAGDNADSLLDFLDRERVDAVEFSPAQLRLMLDAGFGSRRCRNVSRVIVGGEAIDETLWTQLANHPYIKFFNLYGPTECTVDVTCCPIQGHLGAPSLGRPLDGCCTYILDQMMQPVPVGIPGELFVGGVQVARGYYNLPRLTAESFVPDPFGDVPGARLYRTGDRVRYREDGTIEFLGRVDDQVKVRGFRIELGEVEASLKQLPGVADAAVLVREYSPGDSRLVGYVVAPEVGIEELKKGLKALLPHHMVPSSLVLVEKLPLTPNGKIDRKALPLPEHGRFDLSSGSLAPRNSLELLIARIWEDILGVHPIGVRDDFFDSGGHSLLAIRLLWRIEEAAGTRLPIAAFMEEPTVEHLANLLRKEVRPWAPLVELRKGGRERQPIFLCHPVGGNILCYADLIRSLRPDRSVYGLHAGLEKKDGMPRDTIEDMAAFYLEAIRSVKPSGPYLLGGWSMGGTLAYEMSQQLRRSGEHVDLLVLIDCYVNPFECERVPLEQLDPALLMLLFYKDLLAAAGHDPAFKESELLLMPPDERRRVLDDVGEAVAAIGLGPKVLCEMQQVFERNLRAAWKYVPQPYQGNVLSYETDAFPGGHGWDRLISGNFVVDKIASDHYSLLRRPHVEKLAERLTARLDEIHTSRRTDTLTKIKEVALHER